MRRREFITILGGAAAWPFAARAQQPDGMRLIGVITGTGADDPESKARHAAFEQALQQLGWTQGRNVRIDYRFVGAMPPSSADKRKNWSRSRRTSSCAQAAHRRDRYFGRPTPCRSCSRSSPIQSAPVSSIAWRSRAAMPPASCCSNMA